MMLSSGYGIVIMMTTSSRGPAAPSSPQAGTRAVPRVVHPVAGAIAFFTIASFWVSTLATELFGSRAAIVALKTAIPWGFWLLIPALLATGASGFVLARGQKQGRVGAKARRMPFIAANGLLVLVPSALFLADKARAGVFDRAFYGVQALELMAGALNLTLLGMGMRDGFALTAWKRGSFLKAARAGTARVSGVEAIAQGTLALRVAKPPGFTFRAGQAVYVALPGAKRSDDKGLVRTFSIASAPHEEDLLLATRISESTFKQELQRLSNGDEIQIEGPYGDLVLHKDATRPAVFIAGGVGITPFRSMILDALERGLSHRLVLFYSNRTPESAAFLAELTTRADAHRNFVFVPLMTDSGPANAAWRGERGALTRERLVQYAGDLTAPVYYIAGPPAMVDAMKTLLRDASVRRADIHAEMFTGY